MADIKRFWTRYGFPSTYWQKKKAREQQEESKQKEET